MIVDIFGGKKKINKQQQLRINDKIRAREVRLIDENGTQAGIVNTEDALARAKSVGFDLIEVSPTATPPVCRIMDYGKYKYEQSKRTKEASKKSKQAELSLIRLRPNIDDHDFLVKLKSARKFIDNGDKVRIFVMFRNREMAHPEFGRKLLERFIEELADIANVEKPIGMEGRQISLVLSSKGGKKSGASQQKSSDNGKKEKKEDITKSGDDMPNAMEAAMSAALKEENEA